MATIKELQAEIAKEKGYLDYERNETESREEKRALEKQLRDLKFQRKFGKKIEAAKPIIREIKAGFNRLSGAVSSMQLEQNRREKQRRGIFG